MVASRPDIDSNLIKDGYIKGHSWNLVCDSNIVQAVSFVADTFLGAVNRALSVMIIARLCRSNAPHSLDKQPRIEYIKQYKGDGTVFQPTFGTNLKAVRNTIGH